MIVKCKNCTWMDWSFITQTNEENVKNHYCGLHGSAPVNPEDNGHGFMHKTYNGIKDLYCGFEPKNVTDELNLFNEEDY